MSDAASPSALAGSALLLFSFGPVQPFIAAARKTADLWTGSTLLSRLAREALRPVRDECGDEAVIFPALPAGDAEAAVSYPNRFVASVPDAHADALAALAHEALQSALSDLVSGALDRAHITNETARALADRQVETFLDVNWSILPLQQGREYGEQYHQLERQLGARKATRSFDGRTAPGYRCDLIPKLAALVPARDCSPGVVRDYWAQRAERLPASRLRDGEELSAVALAKRLAPDLDDTAVAPDEEAFPSTSSLATADFKAAVLHAAPEHDDLRSAVDDYVEAMEALASPLGAREAPLPALEAKAREAEARESGLGAFARISGEWLFPSSFDPDRLGRQDTPVPPAGQEEALQALQALHAAAGHVGISPPSRYYALLLLDGDNMGAFRWTGRTTNP